jgi:hypothetical protein
MRSKPSTLNLLLQVFTQVPIPVYRKGEAPQER